MQNTRQTLYPPYPKTVISNVPLTRVFTNVLNTVVKMVIPNKYLDINEAFWAVDCKFTCFNIVRGGYNFVLRY